MSLEEGAERGVLQGGGQLLFNAVLRPNRSLSPLAFRLLIGLTAGVVVVGGTAFLLIGAWPVFGFLGVELALLYGALQISFRSSRLTEEVQVSHSAIEVRRLWPNGREQSWTSNPHWSRVSMTETERAGVIVRVSEGDKSIRLGSFLSPDERREFGKAFKEAVATAR
ncbi:MAG: DUF2244 domain-containing protein, partial [Pseudomonadota bacterium]